MKSHKFEPLLDSDQQMYAQQDGVDAYGEAAPCKHCGETAEDHALLSVVPKMHPESTYHVGEVVWCTWECAGNLDLFKATVKGIHVDHSSTKDWPVTGVSVIRDRDGMECYMTNMACAPDANDFLWPWKSKAKAMAVLKKRLETCRVPFRRHFRKQLEQAPMNDSVREALAWPSLNFPQKPTFSLEAQAFIARIVKGHQPSIPDAIQLLKKWKKLSN